MYDLNHMTTSNISHLPSALQALLPVALQPLCIKIPCVKGERLFALGKKPNKMFYVASGEVVLQRLGVQGENIVLQRARLCFVAEASLLSSSYHCEAVVTVSGELVAIPIEPIKQALRADPVYAMR